MRVRPPFLCVVALALGRLLPSPASGGEEAPMDMIRINRFIARWERSAGNELGNAQTFTSELMDLLGVGRIEPARKENKLTSDGFERHVQLTRPDGKKGSGRLDYYRAGHLVFESKQSAAADPTPFPYPLTTEQRRHLQSEGIRRGTATANTPAWDLMMEKAFQQAENYARALPPDEACPPFIIVADVGVALAVYANFDREMGFYTPFPNAREHRIPMADLRKPEVFNRLRAIWTDPFSLDHRREMERVTTDLARRLGDFAVALEDDGHAPADVANFLMRFIATAYAEDVALLPAGTFTQFINDAVANPESFEPALADLWESMVDGGACASLHVEVNQFGPFFKNAPTIALKPDQLRLLHEAAKANWAATDPVIFGAILERALSNRERFKLGAYFTSRTVVERLIAPTIIQPLRDEWATAKNIAWNQLEAGDIDGARETVFNYQKRLSRVTVLDPAAGSGNILFVVYHALKTIEEEVAAALKELGVGEWLDLAREHQVSPNQLFGIELNPKAAAVSELILHLSYLQWHNRTKGSVPPPAPILREGWAIDCRDAVLAWDAIENGVDAKGQPTTRYVNPRPAEWPRTEFVIGNPPYVGGSRRREALGEEYNNALATAYPWIPKSADYCMIWVDKAARLAREGKLTAFGFITTSTVKQGANRDLVRPHLAGEPMPTPRGQAAVEAPPLSIIHAIPDHNWDGDGAAVKVSITSFRPGVHDGVLATFKNQGERWRDAQASPFAYAAGRINAGLTIGPDVSAAVPLRANAGMANRGMEPAGAGFVVTPKQAASLGLGRIDGLENHIRHFRNGQDIAAKPRGRMVIDLYGLTEPEVKERYPDVYGWMLIKVKPIRENNNRESRRQNWLIFGEPRPGLRAAHQGLPRYSVTLQTAMRRYFVFMDIGILPDTSLVSIASEDAYLLGVLSSRLHMAWEKATSGRMESGSHTYRLRETFDTFPFPDVTPAQMDRIRLWAERLDAHRKERQAAHPDLTLTGLYAALYKAWAQEDLNVADQKMADMGDLDALMAIHAELDDAVADAYGWPADLTEEAVLQRLLDLNRARAAEEAAGQIRYLRPEYQNPTQEAPKAEPIAKPQARRPAPEQETAACLSHLMVAA